MSSHSPFAISDALDLRLPSRSRGSEQSVSVERSLRLDDLRSWAERALDFLAVLAAVSVSLRITHGPTLQSNKLLFSASFALGGYFVLLMERQGAYQPCVSLLAIRETERLLRTACQLCFVLGLLNWLATVPLSWLSLGFCMLTIASCAGAQKIVVHRAFCYLRRKGYGAQRTVIVGAGPEARKLYSSLVHSPKLGFKPIAFLDEGSANTRNHLRSYGYSQPHSAQVLQAAISCSLLRDLKADALFLAHSGLSCEERRSILATAAAAGVTFYGAAEDGLWDSLANAPDHHAEFIDIDGTTVAHIASERQRFVYEALKQAVDFVVALTLLIGLVPVFLVVASLIKFTSPGRVLFRQQRVGRDGRVFQMLKFRTMNAEANAYACSPKLGENAHVTRIGRWLRRSGLDELPQLINVLLGDMSLVGPRPEMPFLVRQYTPEMRQRLAVKPGITGLWQISADRAFHIHDNLEYDLYYARHRTFCMDFAILLHTLVFAPRGT